jgi:hypothetical protein
MNDDKSLFIKKYIITGLHKIETDGYRNGLRQKINKECIFG